MNDALDRAADQLNSLADTVIDTVIDRDYAARGEELLLRYGAEGRVSCRRDTAFHLRYLTNSLMCGDSSIFRDYIAWAKSMLTAYGVPDTDLRLHLELLATVLGEVLPKESAELAVSYVEEARTELPDLPSTTGSFIDMSTEYGPLADSYLSALLAANRRQAVRLMEDAAGSGAPLMDLYLRVLEPVQREIGRLWQMNEISVAQEHFASAATQLVVSRLFPLMDIHERDQDSGRFLAVCVAEELHEIGLRIVADVFELAGWDTHYLGANTPASSVLSAAREQKPNVIGISVTIPFHLSTVRSLITDIRATPDLEQTAILVGGRPFLDSPDLRRRLGADGTAMDASSGLTLAQQFLQAPPLIPGATPEMAR